MKLSPEEFRSQVQQFTKATDLFSPSWIESSAWSKCYLSWDDKNQIFQLTLTAQVSLSFVNKWNYDEDGNCHSGLERHEMACDDCSLGMLATEINAQVDIFLDTTFFTVCPYVLKVWDSSGRIWSLEQFQSWLCFSFSTRESKSVDYNELLFETTKPCGIRHNNSITFGGKASGLESRDFRQYEFGTLLPEIHPITGLPSWALHICQLTEIMELVSGEDSKNESNVHHCAEKGDYVLRNERDTLFLLRWFCLVGPSFGLRVGAATYKRLESVLSETEKI
jgi:hypothetical protein